MRSKNRSQFWPISLLAVLMMSMIQVTSFAQKQKWDLTASLDAVEEQWVENVFRSMSPDERLGQLFMLRAHSNLGADHIKQITSLIEKYQVGGLCFFQGTPQKQIELINQYQALSKRVPLMISMDAEWGLGMRFKDTNISFPRQLTLGAIQDNQLLYDMGKEIGRQLRRIGVHINFAPVADVNNNADNPVINTRSFGEDRYNVAVKSYMYALGLQDKDVLACAKHFPGHGDTDVDSHYDLPIIPHNLQRLDSIELYPFQALFNNGIGSVMVAHLQVPKLDDRSNRPTSLSRKTVTQLAKEQLGFKGLIFTDGLDMQGVTKHYSRGQVEAEALAAGNDVLLLPKDVGAAIQEIKNYIGDGRLSLEQVNNSVKKILRAKYRLGITRFSPISTKDLDKELNTPQAEGLKQKLIENALTLVRNRDKLLPLSELDELDMASLSIGVKSRTTFQNRLETFKPMLHLQTGKMISKSEQDRMIKILDEKDVVVVGIHKMSSYASREYGLTREVLEFLEKLSEETKVILSLFGSPYSLKYFDNLDWVLNAYDGSELHEDLAAQAIFGAISLQGRLPVTASAKSTFGTGLTTARHFRLGYALPESVGLNSDTLQKIGMIAQAAIDSSATPGCVVLVAKSGKIVYQKAFGYHTTARQKRVKKDDIYDLASVTKVAATTLAMMKLQEEGKVDINLPINHYLPELNNTNKAGLIIKDIMAHHAGLIGWIPFYKQTISQSRRNPQPLSKFYQRSSNGKFNIPVAANLYMRSDFRDSIQLQIRTSELRQRNDYRYSDLGFYLLADLIHQVTGKSIDAYMTESFYEPLGLQTTTYNPWQKLPAKRIVPSENDVYFRRRKIQAYVHDMGAAMLGGVSGHAGLFANAEDVAVLMQMLLQDGYYGGKRYLEPKTIREFTKRHPRSTRRGIGFDMLETDNRRDPNMSTKASLGTFGHLGFTGTCVWADPEHDLIYVFLSNRTYPSMHNYRLVKMDIRPRIQTVVYEAMEAFQQDLAQAKRFEGGQ